MDFKRIIKMTKTGELFFRIKEELSVFRIKNKIIKNMQLEYRESIRIKKKYGYILENMEKNETKSYPSNKVWIFWYQGIDKAPKLIQKCIESIKNTFKDKEVIILTKDNYKQYVEFPEYINKKFANGTISYTHFSDLLRIELLAKYGGTWCDATVFCTGKIPEYITDAKLFVFKNIELDRNDKELIAASNWFISAYSNNDIIVATRNLLFEYWKQEKFLTNYFIFHLFFKMVIEKFEKQWKEVPTFNNVSPHILQFELLDEYDEKRFEQIKLMSPIHKLNKVIENKDKNATTFYEHILNS